eukprot:7858026-Pyramimonas_sp.AAC.1
MQANCRMLVMVAALKIRTIALNIHTPALNIRAIAYLDARELSDAHDGGRLAPHDGDVGVRLPQHVRRLAQLLAQHVRRLDVQHRHQHPQQPRRSGPLPLVPPHPAPHAQGDRRRQRLRPKEAYIGGQTNR